MTNRTEAFKRDCRIINMKKEYPGYTGEILWLVISRLSEKELKEEYPSEIKPFCPFIYMPEENFTPILEYRSNDRKHEIRAQKMDAFAYEDEVFEARHPEMIINPFDQEDWSELHEALNLLPDVQRRRIIKRYFYEMSIMQIATEEGSSRQAVNKSILTALDFLKKCLQ
jgi:RNA polymerase sigma-70 factor (ECF subfamily)